MRGTLWFEDFAVGQRFATRGATLSRAQILDFAWRFDPQPFHIDAEAAQASPYGGLIASGFHTLLLAFRLVYQEGILDASLGSPGAEDIRWLRPVRPDDTLRVEAEVVAVRPSRSRSDRGTVTIAYQVSNQRGEVVMRFRIHHLIARRKADPA